MPPKFVQIKWTPAMTNIDDKAPPPPARDEILSHVDELYRQIEDEDCFDGREQDLESRIKTNLPEPKYSPTRVLDEIDRYGINKDFLMTIGPHKRHLITEHFLTSQKKPKIVIELGTYIGYTAVFLGHLLRDVVWQGKPEAGCKVYSVEMDEMCANIARTMIQKAGLEDTVEVVVGEASTVLRNLVSEGKLAKGAGEVDLVLIDHWEKYYVQDLEIMTTELGLVGEGASVCADNIQFPGVPEYVQYLKEHEAGEEAGEKKAADSSSAVWQYSYENREIESMMPNGWADILMISTVQQRLKL